LFEREERYDVLPAELGAITAYIADRATPRA
jgi:threonine synthase